MSDEGLKLVQQDSARLIYFTQYLFEIKTLVTCSICLDILEKPVQLQCSHAFCESCIQTHLKYYSDNEAPCPICQKVIKSTIFQVQDYYTKVVAFVKKQLKEFHELFNFDIDEKISFEDILLKVKQNCTHPEQFQKNRSFKLNTKCGKLKVGRNVKLFSLCADDSSKTSVSPSDSIRSKSSTESSSDPFDRLKKTQEFNKWSVQKTYENAKKGSNIVDHKPNDLITTNANTIAVHWLEDKRNNFEIIPKTEQKGKIKIEVPEFDMPSVSQLYKNKSTSKTTKKGQSKRLTRSVGYSTRTAKVKQKLRHSAATCLSPKLAVVIEQFNSEEEMKKLIGNPTQTAKLRHLEESYLDAIDEEMIENKLRETNDCSGAASNKKGNIKGDASSGWKRIREMKKIINKSQKRTAKFEVIETPCTKSKRKNDATRNEQDWNAKSKKFQPTVNLERLNSSKFITVSYDLNVVESYMNENMVKLCNGIMTETEESEKNVGLLENNDDQHNVVEMSNEGASRIEKPKNMANLTDGLSNSSNNVTLRENNDAEKSLVEISNEDAPRMEIFKRNLDLTNKSSSKKDNEIIQMSQHVDVDVQLPVAIEPNKINNQNLKLANDDDDDDIFAIPTQDIRSLKEKADSLITNNYNVSNVIKSESIDKMYSLDLSKFSFTSNKLPPEFYKTVCTLNDAINQFIEGSSSHKERRQLSSFINNIKMSLKNVMQSLLAVGSTEPPVCKSICVQTHSTAFTSYSHNVTTQTAIPYESANNKCIQTDSMDSSKGFRISTIDTFNIPVVSNIETQTEPVACLKCNCIASSASSKSKRNSESIFLSGSFDNLQFDTQTVVGGKVDNPNLQIKNSEANKNNENLTLDAFKQPQASKSVPLVSQDVISQTFGQNPKKTSTGVGILTCANEFENKLSGSFDYLQFDTQAVLKGKAVNASAQLESSNKDSANLIVDTFQSRTPKSVSTVSKEVISHPVDLNFKKSNKLLSESFDNLQFDTQAVLKAKAVNANLSLKSSEANKDSANLILDTFQSQASKSVSSVSQKVISHPGDQKRTKTNKRVRRLSFDSESDELLPKYVKRNKYMQENVSLVFESEDIGKATTEEDRDYLLSNDNEDINYQRCLEKVLQRSEEDENKTIPQDGGSRLPPAKRSKTQEMLDECQMIIQEAYSGPLHIENTANITSTLFNNKNSNLQGPSKLTMSILDEEFEHDFHGDNKPVATTNCDIVTQNKNTNDNYAENKNKCSESIFTNCELECNKTNQASKRNLDESIDCFNNINDSFEEQMNCFNDINDSFEEQMEIEDLPLENKNIGNVKDKIVIIQDICINKGNENTDEKDPDSDFNKSSDVFLSDSDIVETTPQSCKAVSCEDLVLMSQCYYKPAPIILPPLVEESPDIVSSLELVPLSCLNKTFTPPLEFQDSSENQTVIEVASHENDVTLKPIEEQVINKQNVLSSLTPDILVAPHKKPEEDTHNLIASTPNSENSQIISVRSLNLSPIRVEESIKHQNPILAAQNSEFSPLNILKCETTPNRLRDFGTSTPKQKSILNYVRAADLNVVQPTRRTSQRSQSGYRKPIIACTRMNEEQMRGISALCNKKLINYSKVFSPSVTHMIVSTDENQCIFDHTMKYLSAVAAGIWVLGFKWIEECLKRNCILPEDEFEALDVSGIDGPRQSRLFRLTKPLLRGYVIYAAPPFVSTTQIEMESIIKLLGGEVVSNADDLKNHIGRVRLIITEGRGEEDYDVFESWLETLKVVTVDMEWLSRSVGQYEKLNLRHFALCYEDSFCDLGYPSELVSYLSSI